MTQRFVNVALAIIVAAFLLAVPASADQRGGSSSGGSSSGGSSSGGSSSGGSSSGGSSSGGSSQGSGGGGNGGSGGGHASGGGQSSGGGHASGGGQRAANGGSGGANSRGGHQSGGPATTPATGSTGGSANTGSNSGSSTAIARHGNAGDQNPRTLDGTASGTPQYSRPRDGRNPTGTAVPRGTVPGSGSGVFIPAGYYGGLYPFGYGYYGDPYGYYGGYYGGYYDPWYGGYPSYVQTSNGPSGDEEGALRLKVKPKEAEVYVDGYYVGIVDDFNGVFQKLHIETGTHRIEVRAPGYEPLAFDVRITPGHKSTYEGELTKIP